MVHVLSAVQLQASGGSFLQLRTKIQSSYVLALTLAPTNQNAEFRGVRYNPTPTFALENYTGIDPK